MKKILALVLALALIGAMIPFSATAETTTHQHNICADSSCKEHGAETWQPWSNATTLPTSGQYYLTTDVNMTAAIKTTGNLSLCLNGHTVTAASGARHLMVGFGYTFNLTDCGTTGKLTGGTAAWGASISLDYKATFNMYGGTITGNSNTASSGGIGAIYLRAGKVSGSTHTAGGTMNMYGGTITGNTGKSAGAIYIGGGTDDLLDGTLNMYGGTITGNTCASGAVYTATNAQVNLLGGAPVIRDNQGSNLNLGANGSLQVKELKAGAKIFVNATTARTISANTDKDYASFFEADNASWSVITQGGKLALSASAHKHNICADSTCADHGTETWSPWTDPTTLPLSGQYYLTTDVTLTAAIKTTGDLKLCLNGCTVTATNGARHVMVGYGYTFSLTDCGTTGKLTGGTAAWGASISLDYKGTFNMYGGTITGNENTTAGSGIGAIYVRPGKVSGSTHTAGGTMNLYGGTISGNTGKSAGAIYIGGNTDDLLDGILNVYGGTITGNNCTSGAVYTATNAQVNLLGGKPVIADNQGGNLNLGANGNLQVKDLQTGAKISVAAASARAISTETDKDYAEFFQADNSALAVRTENGKLTLVSGHLHNLCADPGCTDHAEETWLPWSKTDSLPTEGRYYLDTDVQLSAQVKTTGDLQLCLNGHTVTAGAGARHFVAAYGTTLSLTDCGTTGKLTGGTAAWGASISMDYKATFNMYGGTITGNENTATSGGIGAIYVRPGKFENNKHTAGGTMNLYGGTISGNTGKIAGAIYVGGQTTDVTDAVLNIYGGTLESNTCDGPGGAIYGAGNAQIKLLGGKLQNNTATEGGAVCISGTTALEVGSVTVSGNTATKGAGICVRSNAQNPTLSGAPVIFGNQGGNLHLGGSLVLELKNISSNAKVGISADKFFRYISNDLDAALAGCFTSDRSSFFVEHRDGKLYLGAASGHDHCLCNGTTDKCDHTKLTWAPWEETTSLPAEGTYYLTTDVVLADTVNLTGDLQLCLNGHTVTAPEGKRHMNISKDCRFALTDCNAEPGVFTGGTQTYGAAISVRTGGQMYFYGGKFSGNSNESEGGAIYLQAAQKFGTTEYAGAKFYMYGGEISGNTALIGGGISVGATSSQYFNDQTYDGSLEDPVLHIYGGKIVNNVSTGNGGGIYTRAYSDSQILGGIISGNTAKLSGGGVYANGQCDLQLIGGVIEKNYAGKYGGGVHGINSAVIHLSGTPIRYNSAKETGGGVGLSGSAELRMTGSSVSYNSAANGGGVIIMSKGVVNLRGGSISGNSCTKNGGGIYVSTNSFLNVSGGSISSNKATGHGGGVYFLKSTGNIYGGTISGNQSVQGSGLYASTKETVLRMSGGQITGNTAAGSGTIYLYYADAKFTGGSIHGNDVKSSAGGILIGGADTFVTLENVKFYGNAANTAGAVVVQGRADMLMKNCEIYNNVARTGSAGAIYVSNNSSSTIEDTKMYHNQGANGGAFYATLGTNVTLERCTIENNTSTSVGAAAYTRGNLNVKSCVIRNNTAEKNGGGIATWKIGANGIGNQPGLLVEDTLIESNTAGGRGGGLYLELGCNAQLTRTQIIGNTAAQEGGALYAIDDLFIHGMTATGNSSGGEGYAVYLDSSRYDGHSYHTGLMKMCGDVIVRDNQGGDLWLGETTVIATCAEDFGPKTYIHLNLDSGNLTSRVFGTYNYEGGDLDYILTYGTRSIDDPEAAPAAAADQSQQTESSVNTGDILLYVGVGAVALAVIAAVLILLKKKKPAHADKA